MHPVFLIKHAQIYGHVETVSEELISSPYKQFDGPPREAFERHSEEEET